MENKNCFENKKSIKIKNIIDTINFNPEAGSRIDIGGFSIGTDTLIILVVAFFLLTNGSCDIWIIICLGLVLLNINLNPFQ